MKELKWEEWFNLVEMVMCRQMTVEHADGHPVDVEAYAHRSLVAPVAVQTQSESGICYLGVADPYFESI